MRRALLASAGLHGLAVLAVLLLNARADARLPLPPAYQVNLVSAAELAPMRTLPEPRPAEPVEEEVPETVAEDEPAEKVPDPDVAEPAPRRVEPPGREPTPRPGPDRGERIGPGLPVSLEGRPFEYPWYLETLVGKIGRNWRPTGSAALSATVHFRIDRRGRLREIELAEGSGNLVFDRSALRAVQASDPMPPLPAGYRDDYLGVYFVFDAAVRGAEE